MPKTLRAVTTASSTISRPPSGSTIPVSSSVSAPVIAIDSAHTSSSVSDISSVPLSAVQPESITAEPLLSGGQSDCDLFRKFQLFVEWEKCSHPPSGAPSSLSSTSPVVVASSRPIYTLAPSALSCTINPPRSDLGSSRPSTILASSRGQGAHVLPARGDAFPSQATRLHSSVEQSDNGDRSRASLSRGNFEDRDVCLVSGGQSLADYCKSGNIRGTLIFAYFAQIQQARIQKPAKIFAVPK